MDNTNPPTFSPGYALTTEQDPIDAAVMHASLTNSCWPPSQVSPIHQNPFLHLHNRVSDLDYPSPASSVPSPTYQPQPHQHAALNNSAITSDKVMPSAFPQVESVIGPDRVMTRRQRAALDQTTLGRRLSVPSNFTRGDRQGPLPRHRSDIYFAASRPQTPDATRVQTHCDRLSLTTDSALLPNHSPSYKPMTPTSLSSPYSPYPYYPTQPRSDTTAQPATELRQGSPSNSITSSVSVQGTSGPIRTSSTPHAGVTPRVKHKKQRLCNAQRKEICEYAEKNPNARQEDMAMIWHVERSTVSKILKHKDKWLRLPHDDYNYISKHREVARLRPKTFNDVHFRNSKFPEIEADLEPWLTDLGARGDSINDAQIRSRAKEVAQKHGIPEDKFKASSGWIENFKQRHGIRQGKVVRADGKDAHIRHTYATMNQQDIADTATSSVREPTTLQAPDGRLTNGSVAYQPPSWTNYSQPDRTYPPLDASLLQNSPTSDGHVRNEAPFAPRFTADQHAAPEYNGDSHPTIEQAYEALGVVRHFLDTYHRREYLINLDDDDVLGKLAKKFSGELAGTIIDKA